MCVCVVDGVQQCVSLADSVHGSEVVVADLTIAFTGTSFDMEKFPNRTTHNGVTNGNNVTVLLKVMNASGAVWCGRATLFCASMYDPLAAVFSQIYSICMQTCLAVKVSAVQYHAALTYSVYSLCTLYRRVLLICLVMHFSQ